MEFSKLLSAVADKGWKVSLAAALASAAILLAHRLGFPDPTSLQPYLGATTVAGILGLAVVVVAVIDYVVREVGSGISEARDRAETQATRQRDYQQARSELEAFVTLLERFQREKLLEVMQSQTGPLVMVSDGDGPAQSLVGRFLIPVERTTTGELCRLHPLLQHEREAILARLRQSLS